MPVSDRLRSTAEGVRRALRRLHPGRLRQRWARRSLDLDPERLRRPIPEPGANDFIITGCPRTGTSLAAAALFQPPTCVTLVEPWAGMKLPPKELFSTMREAIRSSGRVDMGTLDLPRLLEEGKVVRVPEGAGGTPAELTDSGALGIKWPSFYRYLDELPTTKFVVCLRHPYSVIGSFISLSGSGLREGQDYDLPFNRGPNAAIRRRVSDMALRRIEMFDYIHERLGPHLERENVFVLRYERWFSEPTTLLGELSSFLGRDLSSMPVAIRDTSSPFDALSPSERALVRRHSRMAHRLGYQI